MSDISIREQREAVESARDSWHEESVRYEQLHAAALTLAKVERGEYVLKRGLTQEQIDDIGIPYFPSDYERP